MLGWIRGRLRGHVHMIHGTNLQVAPGYSDAELKYCCHRYNKTIVVSNRARI